MARPELEAEWKERQAWDRLARKLLWRERYLLFGVSAAIVFFGFAIGLLLDEFTWLSRSGAVLVAIGLFHSAIALRTVEIWQLVDSASKEIDPTAGSEELGRITFGIQRTFAFDHLVIAGVGTILWGFGDLLNHVSALW